MKLEIKNLSFSYKKKGTNVLKNINFSVESGDIVAILGTNGSGKSTLLKCISSILKPTSGEIFLDNKNLEELKSKEKARHIGLVPQTQNFSDSCVYEEILIGRKPFINFEPKEKDHQEIEKVVKLLNLEDIIFKNINKLSGGERQKVLIARTLVQKTDIILLDEPTNNLDIKNQMEIIEIIKNSTKTNNLLTLTAIHDLNLALKLANKFILLKNGEIVDIGDSSIITKENLKIVYDYEINIQEIDNEKYIHY